LVGCFPWNEAQNTVSGIVARAWLGLCAAPSARRGHLVQFGAIPTRRTGNSLGTGVAGSIERIPSHTRSFGKL
jgi:hypothetical protein